MINQDFFSGFPYSDSHTLNLDWILQEVAQLDHLPEDFEALKAYVDNYFTDLDVRTEINAKLDQMYAEGKFEQFFGNVKLYSGMPEAGDGLHLETTNSSVDGIGVPFDEMQKEAAAIDEELSKKSGIRIATYNVGYSSVISSFYNSIDTSLYNGYGINVSKAAIVGAQEMSSNAWFSAKDLFADDFRTNVYSSKSYGHNNLSYFDNGFISHYPISEVTSHVFETQSTSENGYIHGMVQLNGQPVSLYCTHTWYKAPESAQDAAIAEGQYRELLDALRKDKNKYKIMMGDFNIVMNDPNTFGHDLMHIFTDDGYKIVNEGDLFTVWGSRAVDNIILSPNIIINKRGVENVVIDNGGIDHSPLWAEITFA